MSPAGKSGVISHRDDDVLYQIFPDRFRRGRATSARGRQSPSGTGQHVRLSADHALLTATATAHETFYGGDLRGIRRSLDALQWLGISGIVLNPIFAAHSTHRYDPIDYLRIDGMLGDRTELERLSCELKSRDMRLILDGVFDHTSSEHPWHTDEATRRRRYLLRADGSSMTWLDSGQMPRLDTQREEVVESILSIVDIWPEADGWRLDACHLLPHALLRRLRTHLAPRTLIAEDWCPAGHYFRLGLVDGVTNFPFRQLMRAFFRQDCSAETLLERMRVWIDLYPAAAMAQSWNYLDSHDLPRFRTETSRWQTHLALVVKLTTPGTPVIYQGLELGLQGRTADEARGPIPWDDPGSWDQGTRGLVKALIALRRSQPVLCGGRWTPLAADNRTRSLAYAMGVGDDRLVIALSDGSDRGRIHVPGLDPIALLPGEARVIRQSDGTCVFSLRESGFETPDRTKRWNHPDG